MRQHRSRYTSFREVSSKTVPVVTLEKGKVVEKLDGTGTQKTFKLKAQPLRPVERIEHPPGTLLTENRDYTVDYEKGLIEFVKPPEKGKENIIVYYYDRNKTFKVTFLPIDAYFKIHVYSPEKCDELALKTIGALYLNAEKIEKEDSLLKILGFKKAGKGYKVIYLKIENIRIPFKQKTGVMEKIEISF